MTMKKISEKEALLRLTALCSQAEHCSYEMTEKMKRWELTEQEQANVMEYLTRERYVDDERFARAFVTDKIRYNKWGRRKVEQALWMKHIDSDIRRKVLDEVAPEEYDNVLRDLLKSKMKSVKAANSYERNMKLMRFALGRGFDASEVRELLGCDWEE